MHLFTTQRPGQLTFTYTVRSAYSRHRSCAARHAVEAAAQTSSSAAPRPPTLRHAKQRLLESIEGTERGGEANRLRRGEVEEAQVAVEAFSPPQQDFELLEGKWRLLYTTASDVLPLVRPPHSLAPLTPLSIGRIYQRFSSLGEGQVENIIEVASRLPGPLDGVGATLIVEAGWEPRTGSSIALAFQAARAVGLQLTPALQNAVASPLLPRGWLNLQLLQWLRELSVRVPLLPRPSTLFSSSSPSPVGFNYLITFLDEDMLIGRAQGNGGTFIFRKERQEGEEVSGLAVIQELDLIL